MKANLMPGIEKHVYDTREQLAEALVLAVSGLLAGGIATRGSATLAVSGGSTPKMFFALLSKADIDWSNVTVILVDERIVPPDHDRANAKLVRENLLVNNAAAAKLLPYVVDKETPEACATASAKQLGENANTIDAAVLGMGTDGHTASFFPGGDYLSDALELGGESKVLPMRAEGAGEPRLTLSLQTILDARFIALHIEGQAKNDVLNQALGGEDPAQMPVRAVINNSPKPVQVFWAP